MPQHPCKKGHQACFITKKGPRNQPILNTVQFKPITYAQIWELAWPFFLNIGQLKTLLVGFWGWTLIFGVIFVLKDVLFPWKGPKNQPDKEYCTVLTNSAQIRVLFWPFFGDMTCLKTLSGFFKKRYFDFLIYFSLKNLFHQEMAQNCPYFVIRAGILPNMV